LRFVAAIVSFVLAFTFIGLGLAQRTILAEPDTVTASGTVDSNAAVTVIDGSVLNSHEGRQRVAVSGSDTIFAAYGRELDVKSWIGDTDYNILSVDDESGELSSKLVRGKETDVPPGAGSDLWLGEYEAEDSLDFAVSLPDGISLLIMSTGSEPAPDTISISWPVDNRTPWSGPLIISGVILLVLGLALYLWALNHLRRTRGPRRTPPRQAKQQKWPTRPKYKPRTAAKALKSGPNARPADNPRGRRSSRRLVAVVPVFVVSSMVLGGCSTLDWPRPDEATPSASAGITAPDPDDALKDPAVTEEQLERIMDSVAEVAAQSDAEVDSDVLATRFQGPAFELRAANYAHRRVDGAIPALSAIPGSPIALALPQQTDIWPRVVLVVVQEPEDEAVVPTALMLKQASPRDNYRVEYAVPLQAQVEFPSVAPARLGAVRYGPDNKFLKLAPEQVATAYADLLAVGATSQYADQFDLETDTFLATAGVEARAARATQVSGPLALAAEAQAGTGERIPLATDDTGAILALSFGELERITPSEAGATITVTGAVKALSGVSTTTKGVFATYGYQLLFYVPPVSSTEKITLLGATQGITSAGEL
jgi:hypothetical protein